MTIIHRVLAAVASGAAVASVLLAGGPAGAAPLDFAGQKLDAVCTDIKAVVLVPIAGDGAFTPYLVSNGQKLVPISFEVTSGTDLKARHLVDDKVSRTGGRLAGSTTCTVAGQAYDESGQSVPFTAVIVGQLTGRATTPTG